MPAAQENDSNHLPFVVDVSRSPFARLRPAPISAVHLRDEFWAPRRLRNRTTTLLSQYALLEDSGCLDNFRRVAGLKDVPFQGPFFADSDLYKWLEAASTALLEEPNDGSRLRVHVEETIGVIEGAQRLDGYLNTYFAIERADERWRNLRDEHEMYCAGHFVQAAVAHARATGSDRLLRIARRVADNLDETFGPAQDGKIFGVDGHPEIEMALVELFRATGERRYLALAQFFVDARGRVPTAVYRRPQDPAMRGGSYHQDHVPYRELDEVTGHAVRMIYLACGAADLYLETGDDALRDAMQRQWENMTRRRMSVSGGLGARWEGEAFGADYELPNDRAYNETCAAIASVMWNHRLLLATGEARFADLLEWTLFNAVLPGLSLDGEQYFYQNPLADDGHHRRQGWFGCACCPPNVARLLAQLPGYFYGVSENAVWTHLYAEGTAALSLPDGRAVTVTTQTRYPWDGEIQMTVDAQGPLSLRLRVPEWCHYASLAVNGAAWDGSLAAGAYAEVTRAWTSGDRVTLSLPMPVRALSAHPYIESTAGRTALSRGPLLFCMEQADSPTGMDDIRDVRLGDAAEFEAAYVPELLGGVVTLSSASGTVQTNDPAWDDALYRLAEAANQDAPLSASAVPVRLVPYFAWANRTPGRMQVWTKRA